VKPIEIAVIYGNPRTEMWENITDFEVEIYREPDWRAAEGLNGFPEVIWKSCVLPTGEEFELLVGITSDENGLHYGIHVRQGSEVVAQVLCQGRPSVIFRTIGGATVNIQTHESLAKK